MVLKLALIQMNSGSDMDANIAALEALVAEAAGQGATLIATPENTFLMEAPKTPRTLYAQADHPGVKAASALAKKHSVWLLIGSVAVISSPIRGEGGRGAQQVMSSQVSPHPTTLRPHPNPPPNGEGIKTYNRSILFSPEGSVAASYDKIHLFDVDVGDGQVYRESDRFLAGDKAVLATSNQKLATSLGLTICYDLRFPHLYRTLAKAGAQILAVPAAFTAVTGAAHWHVLLRARAIENTCFVIAPAQCGTHPGGRQTYGHSLVVDPWGEIIAERAEDTPGVLMAQIDLDKVAKVRAGLPSLAHDRLYELKN